MRIRNTKTRIPTAVSLMLIFAYSMFMVMVPPTQSVADPILVEQVAEPGQIDLALTAGTADSTRQAAEGTLH